MKGQDSRQLGFIFRLNQIVDRNCRRFFKIFVSGGKNREWPEPSGVFPSLAALTGATRVV